MADLNVKIGELQMKNPVMTASGTFGALGGGKIRRRMTVRQVCAKGRDKEELAHNKDQGDGSHAEQVFQCGVVAHYQMAGNGIQQNLQHGNRDAEGRNNLCPSGGNFCR